MSQARQWFKSKYPSDKNKVYTSRFYTPENSWPKTSVWWLQIPLVAINREQYDYVTLVCQVAPDADNFHCLTVPTEFLNENLIKFHRLGEKISLYLSANPDTLFIEERGTALLDFSVFQVK